MNEEDIRSKVLVPWLQALGFDGNDLRLEFGFSVRIGRDKVKRPRSDVLVEKNGHPLFVVEAKEPGHALTAADREQAISYARLLQPEMCPIAVVTNGSTSEVLDVRTGLPLDTSLDGSLQDLAEGPRPTPAASVHDIELRTRALKRLLSLSHENARRFCRAQIEHVATRTRLEGPRPPNDHELHVPRENFRSALNGFLKSTRTTLLLEAPSGLGKTSACIRAAFDLADSCFALVVPMDQANGDALHYLATEFSWSLSSRRQAQDLLRDLDELCRDSQRKLVLFLDEADACGFDSLRTNLERLHRWAQDLQGRLRIILAVQPATAESLRRGKGYPTLVGQEADTYRLGPLAGPEVDQLIALLRTRFKFTGEVKGVLRSRCADPTFAQLLARDFAGRALPDDIPPGDVFRKYVRSLVARSGATSEVDRVLLSCAEQMLADDKASVSLDSVRARRPDLASDLYDRAARIGLIAFEADPHGRTTVEFVDVWIRNYVVAFLALRIDQVPREEREEWFASQRQGRVTQEAISWFLWAHPADRASFLDGVMRAASNYSDVYNSVLANFPRWHAEVGTIRVGLVPTVDWANPGHVVLPTSGATPLVEWLVGPYSESVVDRLYRVAEDSADGVLRWGRIGVHVSTPPHESGRRDAWEYVLERCAQGPFSPALTQELAADTIWGLVQAFPRWLPFDPEVLETGRLPVRALVARTPVITTYLSLYQEAWRRAEDVETEALWSQAESLVAAGHARDSGFRFRGETFPFRAFTECLAAYESDEDVPRVIRPGLLKELNRPRQGEVPSDLRAELTELLLCAARATRAAVLDVCKPIAHFLPRFGRSSLKLRVELRGWSAHGGQALTAYWAEGDGDEDTVDVLDPRAGDESLRPLRFDPVGSEKLRAMGIFYSHGWNIRSLLGRAPEKASTLEPLNTWDPDRGSCLLWSTAASWLRDDISHALKNTHTDARSRIRTTEN